MSKKFSVLNSNRSEESFFDRQERIHWWRQARLAEARIMVVGAGAIGNETLKNLALLGAGNLFVADCDMIERSNLSRTVLFRKTDLGKKKAEVAACRTKELCLNEGAIVNWFHGDVEWELGVGVFRQMDIVLGCLDNLGARLAINRVCQLLSIPWIDAGIRELHARVEVYGVNDSCYRCSVSEERISKDRRNRYSCDIFKKKNYSEGKVPTVQVTSSLVSAIQVQEAVKLLCGDRSSVGKRVYYNGQINDFDYLTILKDENCCDHLSYPEIVPVKLQVKMILREFLSQISENFFQGRAIRLDTGADREFIRSVECKLCNTKIEIYRPAFRVFAEDTVCSDCKKNGRGTIDDASKVEAPIDSIWEFSLEETEERILNMNLQEIGIPKWHVLAVQDDDGDTYMYFELAGDANDVLTNSFNE